MEAVMHITWMKVTVLLTLLSAILSGCKSHPGRQNYSAYPPARVNLFSASAIELIPHVDPSPGPREMRLGTSKAPREEVLLHGHVCIERGQP